MKLWFINALQVELYAGGENKPQVYEIEAEEKSKSYALDRKNLNCYASVVKKSEMRTYDFIFFKTEKEAKRGLIDLCKDTVTQSIEHAALASKRARDFELLARELEAAWKV